MLAEDARAAVPPDDASAGVRRRVFLRKPPCHVKIVILFRTSVRQERFSSGFLIIGDLMGPNINGVH